MNLDKIFEFFQNNPILNIVFLILAVIGVLATIYFYFKSVRKKEPTFSIRSINLVKDKINKIKGLEIKYQEEKINNLSISKIAFYNNGKETIKTTDVASKDKIRIETNDENKILDSDIIFEKNKANNFNLKLKKNIVEIDFDYFDYGEGIVIQVVHTGKSSQDLTINGSIHGVKNFKEKSMDKSLIRKILKPTGKVFDKLSPKKSKSLILFILFLAPIIVFGIFLIPNEPKKTEITLWAKLFPGIFTTVLYWGLGITIIKNRPPRGFNICNDEFLTKKNKSA
jgi:hypothetical protein